MVKIGLFICNEQELLALPNHLVAFLVFHGRSVVRFICNEQEFLTLPNHLVIFLVFHGRSGCKVDMQRTRIAHPSKPPSHIPGFAWEVGFQGAYATNKNSWPFRTIYSYSWFFMGGRVVRFICNEQQLLTLPNHLVIFLVFHGRSGCTVYM